MVTKLLPSAKVVARPEIVQLHLSTFQLTSAHHWKNIREHNCYK